MNCALCSPRHPDEFWRNENFYLIDAREADFPCFIRVVSACHIKEMSELTEEARRDLWKILSLAEKVIISELHPDKVNYAQFGNMCPHLHWHIIARWKDDTHFPECPWGPRQREVPAETQTQRREQTEVLKEKLILALNSAF